VIDHELEPLFDFVARGRALPEHERPLSISQINLITRTVRRNPEVMLKVVNKGSSSVAGVGGHFGYIGRQGAVELETMRERSCKAQRSQWPSSRIGILI
jgi:hypothetical protein